MDGQQLTPAQLLDAAHRAERQGQREHAAQFYHYLTEQFAYSPEAAEARNGLGRLNAASHAPLAVLNGAHMNGAAWSQLPRAKAPRNYYRTGHALSWLLTTAGWMGVACGLSAPGVYVGLHQLSILAMPELSLLNVIEMAATLTGVGLLALFLGEIARAVFDQANALRDLAALERARMGR